MTLGPVTIPVPLCEGAVGHRVREAPPQPRDGPGRAGPGAAGRRVAVTDRPLGLDGTEPGEPPSCRRLGGASAARLGSVLPVHRCSPGWAAGFEKPRLVNRSFVPFCPAAARAAGALLPARGQVQGAEGGTARDWSWFCLQSGQEPLNVDFWDLCAEEEPRVPQQ